MTSYHVTESDRDYALKLTKRIKEATNEVWELLLEAWNAKAWVSLGYKNWGAYTSTEFDIKQSRAYQLVHQGQVVRQLREAVSTNVQNPAEAVILNEWEARHVKPVLSEVVQEVREQVASGVPADEAVRVAVAARTPFQGKQEPEMLPVRQVEECPGHEYVCVHCGDMLA
jgi:MinD-like ATPase involved in chromosome partitioning or flagellar assembly